jgi:hypothetical protein
VIVTDFCIAKAHAFDFVAGKLASVFDVHATGTQSINNSVADNANHIALVFVHAVVLNAHAVSLA